jgi:hypothetical protein
MNYIIARDTILVSGIPGIVLSLSKEMAEELIMSLCAAVDEMDGIA